MKYRQLAIPHADGLLFGTAPHPLITRRGLRLGGGLVYPELNFTLPAMEVTAATMPVVARHYRDIITDALRRAVDLDAPGVVIEFETLPPMTATPAFGLEIVQILLGAMEEAHRQHGLKSVLRMTPNDNREFARPPVMRSGEHWERMLELFDGAARVGAELLSIESVGGKELHDDALMMGDLGQVIYSQCVLGVRDMEFLWRQLGAIARRHGVVCAGDTACGFGNTAMVLAEQRMIPRVFAAVVRAVSAVRTLVGYEQGAVGPGKDCGYENPYLKAITGYPMAMEGKTSACAHLSPLGNIAGAYADTWSNESVQNVRLLAASAPTCYLEQLIYDCRLMNRALAEGTASALTLRRWMVDSDAALDPQAWVLTPDSVIAIAQAIVSAPNHYQAGVAAARCAITLLRDAHATGRCRIAPREVPFLETMLAHVDALPADEAEFIAQQKGVVDASRYLPAEYGV
ncbi:methyltransferase MtaB domain-containing protein [Opitutus sp. ER46]|uniref:methyltransferase MtaB domain-containing protein n=1 Tax=Opitutus sp. ER46 TaxID=2161864 RepID=UPI000D2FA0ED|nr:methyltransferase MtaB domain-containing protein [Opitutus sp. ER46]PTX92348.1 methanol--corrinoid methyltransferase [Opitutus sp. ER46]